MNPSKEPERKTKLMLTHKSLSKTLLKPNKALLNLKLGFKRYVLSVQLQTFIKLTSTLH